MFPINLHMIRPSLYPSFWGPCALLAIKEAAGLKIWNFNRNFYLVQWHHEVNAQRAFVHLATRINTEFKNENWKPQIQGKYREKVISTVFEKYFNT